MPPFKDLINQEFGLLTAKKFVRMNKHGSAIWLCSCKCGAECEKRGGDLTKGDATHCGCNPAYPKGFAARNFCLTQYRAGAKIRNLQWTLSKELAFWLFTQPCFYCAALPEKEFRRKDLNGGFIY